MIFAYGFIIISSILVLVPLAWDIFSLFHAEHKTAKAVKKAQAKQKKMEDSL